MRIAKVSIDEMARDARAIAGENPVTWAFMFGKFLRCYGYRVERTGRVYFVGRHVVLEDWEIVRHGV